jgi:hypothetical protein
MKKTYIAAFAAAIFMANTESVNAQNEQVINNLSQKAETWWASEGHQTKNVVTEAGQKTYIYDRDDFEMSVPTIRENGKADTLKVRLNKAIRRNETSGVAGGVDLGGLMLDKNFTFAFGAHLTMAWKWFDLTGGVLVGKNKHTDESSLAGQSFITTMVYGEAGVPFRFKQSGYNNMAYIEPYVGYACIFDKNQDYLGENTYTTAEGTVTESGYFDVEGKSAAIYGGVKYRTSLKHMGAWGLTVKVFGGVYQRYYGDGSRRKPFAGVTVGIEFSGAKKRVDSDVNTLQKSLEAGNYELANDFINNLRANMK